MQHTWPKDRNGHGVFRECQLVVPMNCSLDDIGKEAQGTGRLIKQKWR